jgi:hypothetical protein
VLLYRALDNQKLREPSCRDCAGGRAALWDLLWAKQVRVRRDPHGALDGEGNAGEGTLVRRAGATPMALAESAIYTDLTAARGAEREGEGGVDPEPTMPLSLPLSALDATGSCSTSRSESP